MKLSVVILNYNVSHFLELCIASVQAAIKPLNAEIIVVDNNSHDDSCEMVKNMFPNVTLIQNKENVGFSKANNQGVEIAKGEYICILNPDTVVGENCFTVLLKYADQQQNLGMLGCRLIDGSGGFLPESKRNIPTPFVSIKKMLGFSKDYYAGHLNEFDAGDVAVLVGAFMLMKKTVYDEVGGFDEDYFMYGEDIDLSYKVLKKGYQNKYFGKESIIHFKGESTMKDSVYAKRFYGAMRIFYQKHFKKSWWFDFIVLFGVRVFSVIGVKNKDVLKYFSKYVFVSKDEGKFERLKVLYSEKEGVLAANNNEIVDVTISDSEQYVFDMETNEFKDVIHMMSSSQNLKRSFRIMPLGASFILGSDSSSGRGEVLFV